MDDTVLPRVSRKRQSTYSKLRRYRRQTLSSRCDSILKSHWICLFPWEVDAAGSCVSLQHIVSWDRQRYNHKVGSTAYFARGGTTASSVVISVFTLSAFLLLPLFDLKTNTRVVTGVRLVVSREICVWGSSQWERRRGYGAKWRWNNQHRKRSEPSNGRWSGRPSQ